MIPIKGLIAIQVRMAVRQAQAALTGLKGNLNALQTSLGATNAANMALSASSARAGKYQNTLSARVKASGIAAMKSASQFQWFSRQLMYNWGIPLIAAGVIATKWSLETEAAMTRVAKVYGDLRMDPSEKKKELAALAKYFEAVSNRYGMLQKDVISIGAAWAAAGAEAVGLAKATQLTIETMILGEMNAEEATKSLIAIQEAWRVNAKGLARTISELNIVENQTAVDMQGLIEAFTRTGSSARIAGLSTGDLAALIAGLVPAAGNATTAGNSLKTILSRIAAPTKAAERAMGALGFNIDSTSWKSLDARKRLEGMAEAFSKMDRNQQQAIATDIAGRQQYNRFVQVMDALADKNSAYWTAQNALLEGKKKINGVTGLQIQYERELQQVMESNPQAMKMVLARLQNLAIRGFAPLVPYIIAVMQYLVKFAQWLGGLPPEVKKLIAALLLLIVALTAFSKILAALRLLMPAAAIMFGSIGMAVGAVGRVFTGLGKLIIAPFRILSIVLNKARAQTAAAAGAGFFGRLGQSMIAMRGAVSAFGAWLIPQLKSIVLAFTFYLAGPGFRAAMAGAASNVVSAFGFMNRVIVVGFLAMRTNLFKIVGTITLVWPRIVAALAAGGPLILKAIGNLERLLVVGFLGIRAALFRVVGSLVLIWPAVLSTFTKGGAKLLVFFRSLPALLVKGLTRIGPMIISSLAAIGPALMRLGPLLFRVLTGPWGLAISAIAGVVIQFRDQIFGIFQNVVKFFSDAWNGITGQTGQVGGFFAKFTQFLINCFYALPREIQVAMQAVVDIVYSAAMAVYNLFSYLNPFAHHSPSLVENVVNGMNAVNAAFASVTQIAGPIDRAYGHIKKFKDLMASFRNGKGVDLEFADDLKNIKAVNPAALSTARAMISDIKTLQKLLDGLEKELQAQQKVVDGWKSKLDEANAALEEQENILTALGEDVDYYQSVIDDANSSIDRFTSASITGMQAMDDQIQSNTQSQNELKLAMLQMEQASGGFDTVRDRMAALNGEFETLTAKRDELVKLGAGSDILSYYDQQISSIESQKDSIYDTADAYTKMAQKLADLEKQGELLDLTKSVNYDPLIYQIEKLAKSQEELSFDEIINGISDAKTTIKEYTPKLEAATEAYREQAAVVYSLTQQRNAIQRQYDIEANKLDKIKDKYDAVASAISDLRDALSDLNSVAGGSNSKLDKKLKGAGVGGEGVGGYPGGGAKAGGKTFGIKDLEKGGAADIDSLTKKMEAAMEALDLTGPIKEKWEAAVGWWNTNIQPAMDLIGRAIVSWWSKIDWSAITGDQGWLTDWWKGVTEWFGGIGSTLTGIFGEGGIFGKVFGDDFSDAWNNLIEAFKDFGKEVAPGFMEFWQSVKPFVDAVGRVLGDVLKSLLVLAGIILGVLAKALLWIWNAAIRPLLKGLGGAIGGLFKALGGLMDIVTGIFNGDAAKIGQGFLKLFGGIWDIIVNVGRAALTIVFNLIGGLFGELWSLFNSFFPDIGKSISDFWSGLMNMPIVGDFFKWIGGLFVWLYDFLVGHSVVPDTVNAVVGWFKNMVGWLAAPLKAVITLVAAAFSIVYNGIVNSPIGEAISGIVDGIKTGFSRAWEWITSPFKRAEGEVSRSFETIKSDAAGLSADMGSTFGSGSSWDKMGSNIPKPFDTASDKSIESFDKIFSGFKDLSIDLNKSAKTDWKAVRKSVNKVLSELPKDQKKSGKELVKEFMKTGEEIQKLSPKLWEKIRDSISDPTKEASDDVSKYTKQMRDSVNGLNGVTIPSNWKALSRTLSAPTGSAATSVRADIRSMNNSIGNLNGGLPKEWKNLRTSIVDPVRDAKAALNKIRFSTSNITGPLNRIGSAADRVTSALSRMISKWRSADAALGLKYGGAVSLDKLNAYARTLTPSGMATGGGVHGPGGPTSDKVLRYLSSGEHVMTAREVAKLGGQGSVYALRSFIRRNDVNANDLIKAYRESTGRAGGGSVLKITPGTRDALSTSMRRSGNASLAPNSAGARVTRIENATFEFPNVRNGKDAKEFLDNLESMIG